MAIISSVADKDGIAYTLDVPAAKFTKSMQFLRNALQEVPGAELGTTPYPNRIRVNITGGQDRKSLDLLINSMVAQYF